MQSPLIEIIGMGLFDKGKWRLSPYSLNVYAGQKLSIIGKNGAGKSTLLKLLSGLMKPSTGQILYEGLPFSDISLRKRAQFISIVTQEDSHLIPLTVYEYVKLGMIPLQNHSSISSVHLEELLRKMQLWDLKDQRMQSLSGGERQKAKICRALLQNPRIIFLDEPTNHLDPKSRYELMYLLANLNVTIIMVLHDLALAREFSNHTIILEKGEITCFDANNTALSCKTLSTVFDIPILNIEHPYNPNRPPFVVYDSEFSFN